MPYLNSQQPHRTDHRTDGMLDLHSTFLTVQGEGPFSGRYAMFVRLHGCNLQCPFCDTDYTNELFPLHVNQIRRHILSKYAIGGLVVITGGEPFRQNITPLVNALLDDGYIVQVETNGTLYLANLPWEDDRFTVVCSPKTTKIHPETAKRVHAYKYVLAADAVNLEDGFPDVALGHSNHGGVARPPEGYEGPIYLTPMDPGDSTGLARNITALKEVMMNVPDSRFIAGVQLHKVMQLP